MPGLTLLGIALVWPWLRAADGWLLPAAWSLAAAGLGLALVGGAWRTPWQRCAGLFAVALVGQACALGLINAPNYNVLQHYHPWRSLVAGPSRLLLAGLALQTGVVVAGAWRCRRDLLAGARRLLSGPQALLLAAASVFTAANGSFDASRFAGEIALSVWILAVAVLNLVLVAGAVPGDALDRGAGVLRRHLGPGAPSLWSRRLPRWLALWAVGVSATLAWLVFERIPHIPDAVGYLFHAKYLSVGSLTLPAPPDAAAFAFEKVVNDGTRWWAYGFPG